MPPIELECIVKFGGSSITKKDEFETINADAWSFAIEIIRKVEGKCIIVHGAGSFGHFQAKEFRVSDGFDTESSCEDKAYVRKGFAVTKLSVTKLNHRLVSAFVEAGISAVSVSPCSGWRTEDKSKVTSSDLETITGLLENGFLPVLHGDCVLDQTRGCTILSGDTVIEVLASHFKPKRVVFLTDVDGVYTLPPSHKDATLIPEIHFSEDGEIMTAVTMDTKSHDVTGGLKIKLQTAWNILNESKGTIPVFVCNICSKAAEYSCCHGYLYEEIGTAILLCRNQDHT
ncbi:uncharacterized protein [Apostichopus japonicus]|uniref:uncharacterized protein n=1 Tax=Stichopus japonicus TaxID=307972 RepID=UPI003AB24BC3